jgi:hypothetical protein
MGQRMNQPQQQKRHVNPYVVGDNVLETVKSLGGGVAKTAQDSAVQIASSALQDIINGRSSKQTTPSEQTHSHERFPINQQERIQPHVSNKEIIQPLIQKDIAETKQKLEAVRQELQALSKSIRGLSSDIQAAIMEMPVEPGVYHINFFDQLKIMLTHLREQVDDSRTWLSAWSANAKKKRGYWGMYKKHGTTFGLSSERTLATQAG